MSDFKIITVGERNIVVEGVGRLFYQDGFPILMSIKRIKEFGLEVSSLHLAKELLYEWEPKTVLVKLTAELNETIEGDEKLDLLEIEKFCYSNYEDRSEMIFNYLYKTTSTLALKEIKEGKLNTEYMRTIIEGVKFKGNRF